MLVIHNEKDFRHPTTEGVAVFIVLQERGIESAFLTFEDRDLWRFNREHARIVSGGLQLPESLCSN